MIRRCRVRITPPPAARSRFSLAALRPPSACRPSTARKPTRRMFMQISSATNASVIGAVGIGTTNPESAMTCFTGDFDSVLLRRSWTTVVRNGPFTPSLAGNRFQLTQALGNQATGATLQKLFPGANNEVVIEFNHYAYGGSGADGVVVVLSDALVTPQPGGYGGSLGYA